MDKEIPRVSIQSIALVRYDGEWILGSITQEPNQEEVMMRVTMPVGIEDDEVYHYPKYSYSGGFILLKNRFIKTAVKPSEEILRKYIKFTGVEVIGLEEFFNQEHYSYDKLFSVDDE